eukprot:XP_016657554.1 PREDICTED: uncharacterized protein LOC107882920 [Acyrthosiphon pisum]
MKTREVQLLENDIFISAVYLDPRFMCLLTVPNREKAVNYLLKIWDLNKSLTCIENSEIDSTEQPDNHIIDETNVEDDGDDFETFLQNNSNIICNQNSCMPSSSQDSNNTTLKNNLEEFSKLDTLNYKEDIVKFWTAKKNEMPELFVLAQILLAVPATQKLREGLEHFFQNVILLITCWKNIIANIKK